jgi:hypothetical protein
MRSQRRIRRITTALGFAALAAIAFAAPAMGSRQQQADPQLMKSRGEIERIRETRGLHEAAKASPARKYIGLSNAENPEIARDLETIAYASDLVVEGLIQSGRTRIAKDMRGFEIVVTDYRVFVFDVLKGDRRKMSAEITVEMPGGRVQFDDPGMYAEFVTNNFKRPFPQQQYVMFLREHPVEQSTYVLAWGTQALYEIAPDGDVKPGGRSYFQTSKIAKAGKAPAFKSAARDAIERAEQRKVERGKSQGRR